MKLNLALAQINTKIGCNPANPEKNMTLTKTGIDLHQLQRAGARLSLLRGERPELFQRELERILHK